MELLKDTPFETAWVVWKARPSTTCLTVVVKGTFTVVESGTCPLDPEQILPTGDVHHDDDTERSVRYESDLAYIKPKGECFVAGSCFSPDGRPKTAVLAAFKIGPIKKKMAVIGDRYYKGLLGTPTAPQPFTEMPLSWERCFGGRKHKQNPVGVGMDKSPVEGKAVVRLPNIEDPQDLVDNRRQRPKPNGAFPIPRSWPARVKLTGTYDKRWKQTRWPWFPEDFQWSYFNAAPEDQRLDGFFRGDEAISLVGLHRQQGKVECRLPGLRARAFLREGATGELKPLSPELDTITVDTDLGKVLCVWRAVTEVPSESLEEYSHLFVAHERLGEERPVEDYAQRLAQRLAQAEQEEQAFEAEPVPEGEAAEAAPFVPVVHGVEPAPGTPYGAAPEAGGSSVAYVAGLGRTSFGRSSQLSPFPDPVPLDSPVLIPEMSDKEWDELHSTDYEVADDDFRTALDPGWIMPVSQILEFRRFDFEDDGPAPAPYGEASSGEDSTFALLHRLTEQLAQGERPEEEPGEDDASTMLVQGELLALLGLDADQDEVGEASVEQEGADATEMMSQGEMLSALAGALEGPAWAGGPRGGAAGEDAGPQGAEVAEEEGVSERLARRARVQEALAAGASCAGWDLEGADLSGCDLSGCDFTEARLVGADLSGARLDGARLAGANLSRADLSGASLKGAQLDEGLLSEAKAEGARFEEASLRQASASEARLARASFLRCGCAELELAGADLTGARFEGSTLDRADLTGAKLDDAVFVSTSLVGADLGGGTSAKRVKLDGCDLAKLRAYEGGDFTEASFVRAKIGGGRFMGSTLSRANLSFAELDGADFSGAKLQRATLLGCRLRQARFDRALLSGASFGKSDLFQARFERADLTLADLRGCNLFGAELLGADLRGAKLELANLKGTKLA